MKELDEMLSAVNLRTESEEPQQRFDAIDAETLSNYSQSA